MSKQEAEHWYLVFLANIHAYLPKAYDIYKNLLHKKSRQSGINDISCNNPIFLALSFYTRYLNPSPHLR
jgi:hypothetical protein